MKIFCLCLIVFSVVVIVLGIIKVHELPGNIAQSRGHPQADAIRICALLGLIIFLVVLLLSQFTTSATWQIGAVAGIALAVSMCAGTLAGAGIPLAMRRLGVDPAQSSAIFLVMITDAMAFATFLGFASLAARVFTDPAAGV